MISSEFPFESKYVEVLGSQMHYIDEGEGDPILFLHGNPTSSYLWRNIIPYVLPHGRAIALDLIGMGKSDKPDIPYRFQDHIDYVDGFIEALGLTNITLVIHDWGSGIGFHYAARYPGNIRGIAFMEAIMRPARWASLGRPQRFLFKRMRHPVKGERMIVKKNFFIKRLLPMMVVRKLSDAEMDVYRAPYVDPKSRLPLAQWPKEIPFDGVPADNDKIVDAYWHWLRESPIPKLLLWAKPGALISPDAAAGIAKALPNTTSVFVGKGKHYIQEDCPDEIGQAIALWLPGIVPSSDQGNMTDPSE